MRAPRAAVSYSQWEARAAIERRWCVLSLNNMLVVYQLSIKYTTGVVFIITLCIYVHIMYIRMSISPPLFS